jgi:hypothetical protein
MAPKRAFTRGYRMDGALTKVSVFTPAPVEIAYESVLSELAALRDDELLPLNLDPAGVVETLFGVWPRLARLRPELAALSKFDVVVFDKLPHYAGALLVAHGLWKGAARPKSAIGSMAKELWGIRERLYAHAVALSLEGIIERERLRAVKTQRGHRALAVDILTLVPLFRDTGRDAEQLAPSLYAKRRSRRKPQREEETASAAASASSSVL